MCSGSKRKPGYTDSNMESGFQKQDGSFCSYSILLEFAASNDLVEFRKVVEEGRDVDESGRWYGRKIGSKKMGFEERTPLMIAALFGSKDVLKYILETGRVDVNKACGSDGTTALHCAVAGGSDPSVEVTKLLLDASADPNAIDVYGNQPADVIAPFGKFGLNPMRKVLQAMLKGGSSSSGEESYVLADLDFHQMGGGQEQQGLSTPKASKDGTEKKEYPVDLTLPDIKNGIYGTDEFRMFTFKVKPCSRAYSHDWTECPFVHPGENARRRDPRKYHYSCVPCPEFRKGSCRQGDACEYAHGIFECWLHPAQYRTRLCKDKTNCSRRVCFFAHKEEELRPLYASTGSAVPSPRSYSANNSPLDVGSITPLALGSPSVLTGTASTPPLTPNGTSSGIAGWQNQPNIEPPTLQLPGSRLRSALSARDMELDMELVGFDSLRRRQQLMDELSGFISPSSWKNGLSSPSAFGALSGDLAGEMNRLGGVKPTNLEDVFGSIDPAILPQLQGLALDAAATQLQSPTGIQMRQNINQQLRSSYPTSFASSPTRSSTSFGIDPPVVSAAATAAAALSSRSAAFAKRSHSFIERSAVNRHGGLASPASATANVMPSNLADWGSPDGKLDWGMQGEELNKLRKSASFGFRNSGSSLGAASSIPSVGEPDVSWVQTLVKDPPPMKPVHLGFEGQQQQQQQQQQQCHLNIGSSEALPAWLEQMYMEQEQMVA